MNALFGTIIELNIAACAAILFVLLVRRPAARLLGPHAVYSLWAIVPVVMAATILPERTTETVVTEFLIGGVPASLAAARLEAAASWLPAAIGIAWLAGIAALTLLFVRRQRAGAGCRWWRQQRQAVGQVLTRQIAQQDAAASPHLGHLGRVALGHGVSRQRGGTGQQQCRQPGGVRRKAGRVG